MAIGQHIQRAEALNVQGLPHSHRNMHGDTRPQGTPGKRRDRPASARRVGTGRWPSEQHRPLVVSPVVVMEPSAEEPRPSFGPSTKGRVIVDQGVELVVVWDGV